MVAYQAINQSSKSIFITPEGSAEN